jgi:superfamily II DNA or RNA helicase
MFVVFDLYPFDEKIWLPTAWLVQPDANGQPAHIVQKATPETLRPFGMTVTDSLKKLFGLIEILTPKNIEQKHKPPKIKSVVILQQLLADPQTKGVVNGYINRHLDAFLSEVVAEKHLLTLHSEKKIVVRDVLLTPMTETLQPYLFFKKTAEKGIEYRLELGTETESFKISERQVVPFTNTDPAWIAAGYALFRVAGMNGQMVIPFQKKDTVVIPPGSEADYFRKFIAKAVRRSRVEADGFRVEQTQTLQRTVLKMVENVLEQRWLLKMSFEYPGVQFQHGEKRDRVTSIDVPNAGEDGEITVQMVVRNQEQERQKVEALLQAGFVWHGNLLTIPASDNAIQDTLINSLGDLLAFLSERKTALEAAGFTIIAPETEDRTLTFLPGLLDVNTRASGDWFDVDGTLRIGQYQFSFRALAQNLRKNDRFFRLPDGTFFLIPQEWFSRYAELALAAQDGTGDVLRLPKALYPLLQGANLQNDNHVALPMVDPDAIEYTPGPELKASLRPYQLRGVRWLIGHYQNGLGACLADDMGLGKTLQTIALLLYIKGQTGTEVKDPAVGSSLQLDLFQTYQEAVRPLKALIILPASLVFNWRRELEKFAPSLYVFEQTGPRRLKDARALAAHDVVLTTYHTARQDLPLLQKAKWQVIILDESQQIKNRESEVSKVVLSLEAPHKISLSGTPIENSLSDLWTQMEFINPSTLGAFRTFKEQFIVPIERNRDEQAQERLYQRVRPYFMRRTKEEVAPDLPPLHQQVFYTEMAAEQKKEYERLKSAVRNEILSLFGDPKTRIQALAALTRLRQMANHPVLAHAEYDGGSGKMEDVLAQWETIRRAGHKVLFFSSFEKHLQLFRPLFEQEKYGFAWLTGDTATADRAKEVERFQQDASVQAFFMTIKAGGVGLNLTAADYVFILDPWWNPAVEDQAVARAHRIGQQRPVTALRFIARDTVEEKILILQEKKRLLGQELFKKSAEVPSLTAEELEMILA